MPKFLTTFVATDKSTNNNWSVPVMLMLSVPRIGREDLKNRDRYQKSHGAGRRRPREIWVVSCAVVVEDGFPKIIFEVAYVISQLEMMATLFREELNSP